MSYANPKEQEFNAFLTALQIHSELDYEERLEQVERLMKSITIQLENLLLPECWLSLWKSMGTNNLISVM